MKDESMFPVLWQVPRLDEIALKKAGCPRWVPWAWISKHSMQAERNHSQTLGRLAQRGGLSPAEIVAVVEGRGCPFGERDIDAVPRLREHLGLPPIHAEGDNDAE